MVMTEKWIVGKNREWLITYSPVVTRIPRAHLWSRYIHDAIKFESRYAAKSAAVRHGADVYRFDPLTGQSDICKAPEGAACDTCKFYTPYSGMCRCASSENHREPVSIRDVCSEWEAR